MNLDSEDEGELYVGCAGGIDVNVGKKYEEKNRQKGCLHLKLLQRTEGRPLRS